MTITLEIRPEIQAKLARQAAAQGSVLEEYAVTLLEKAVNAPIEATPIPAQFFAEDSS